MNLNLPLTLESLHGKKVNLHTHTYRCKHASGTDREYVERAIEAGYDVLGFSDHMPHVFDGGYVSPIRMSMDELEGYAVSIQSLKKEYAKDIEIYYGFEAEYFPHSFAHTMEALSPYPLDYLILGQHFLDDEIGYKHIGKSGQTEAVLEAHVNRMIEALDLGCFLYAAHPDILNFTGEDRVYEKHMLRLANALKARNIPVEVNIGGYRDGYHYPNDLFLKLAAQNGNSFLIGVDAHAPEELTDHESYNTLVQKIKHLGGTVELI